MRSASNRHPLIGVTGPDRGGAAAWLFTRLAVALAGGRAVQITPNHPHDAIVDQLDGLIIGGGADVDPTLYGQEHLPTAHRVSVPPGHSPLLWIVNLLVAPLIWLVRKSAACCVQASTDDARDRLEIRLLDDAVRRRIPILGICRGAQLINVCFGGGLLRDIKTFYVEDPEVRSILPRKRLVVEPDSRLARALGPRPVRVNALHRQAIDATNLGKGLRVAARDRNGIVQAIEHQTLPLVLGVQWHPEFLPQLPRQREIFCALVKAARRSVRSTSTDNGNRDGAIHLARREHTPGELRSGEAPVRNPIAPGVLTES